MSAPNPSGLASLRELIARLGFAHAVDLLAALADEQGDLANRADEGERAKGAAHDGKVLDEAAKRLLG